MDTNAMVHETLAADEVALELGARFGSGELAPYLKAHYEGKYGGVGLDSLDWREQAMSLKGLCINRELDDATHTDDAAPAGTDENGAGTADPAPADAENP